MSNSNFNMKHKYISRKFNEIIGRVRDNNVWNLKAFKVTPIDGKQDSNPQSPGYTYSDNTKDPTQTTVSWYWF